MDEEALIEQLMSAHRERAKTGEIRFAPAFHDLSATARQAAFALTCAQRNLEAALDPQELSTTARAVRARLER
jgi:hypothetical protein